MTQAEPLEAPSPEEPPPPPPPPALTPSAGVRAALFAGALLLFGVVVGWKWLLIILGVVVLIFVHELGPLRHGSAGRHAGHRVLHRVRPAHLLVPSGRDRVRAQGDPRRRLREGARDVQHRRGRSGDRTLHVPPGPVARQARHGARWAVRQPDHGGRALVRVPPLHRRRRRGAVERRGRRRRHRRGRGRHPGGRRGPTSGRRAHRHVRGAPRRGRAARRRNRFVRGGPTRRRRSRLLRRGDHPTRRSAGRGRAGITGR